MHEDWQTFLETQGARIEGGRACDFGDIEAERAAASDATVLADLAHYGLIRVTGEDARDFLQNQFGNDVNAVSDTQAQLSSYSNAKGRMLAIFHLFLRDDAYYLVLPADILESTLKRLRMFVLRSQVTLEDASDTQVRIGLAGEQAPALLSELLDGRPERPWQVMQQQELVVLRLPDPLPRFEIHGPVAAMTALWQRLARQARPVGADVWTWLNIRAGLPDLHAQTVEAFVPQMANLEALDAISFKKGCYPGQEVVARMHYLGKLKRRMYLAHADSDAVPAPGTAVYAEGEEQAAGQVVEAARAPGGGTDLLMVVKIASAESPLHLESPSGPALELRELPYTVLGD